MQHSPAAPFGRHSRAGARPWLRPLGVFLPGRSSAVFTGREVRVWSAVSIPSRVLSSPRHTSGPARPRQEGPPDRHRLSRGSPAPATILFSGTRRAGAQERARFP
ncbi:hypothetical protein NDU88_006062 [Pleurodeles waltl]|uniref:Uncharacterized protein n=1 Tax=Pleurodeles waltl TaxID=8319 RepID=A0AAV7ULB1_PLEWA|nr:hypothetical protein NDU88_006062 [Pleurodeles waltl]